MLSDGEGAPCDLMSLSHAIITEASHFLTHLIPEGPGLSPWSAAPPPRLMCCLSLPARIGCLAPALQEPQMVQWGPGQGSIPKGRMEPSSEGTLSR